MSADVVGGRLVRGREVPVTSVVTTQNVEAVRLLHLETADRLIAAFAGHNAAPALRSRIEAVRRTLAHPFNETSGTALGIQAEGLTRLLPAARDLLIEQVAADVEVFASDLADLAWQFSMFRDFTDNARRGAPLLKEQIGALAAVSREIEAQPDDVVAPDLKQDLADVRAVAEENSEATGQLGLLRAVINSLRAIGRALQARIAGVGAQAAKTFDEETGKALGGMLNKLVVGGGLLGLAVLLPVEFKFLPILLAAANLLKSLK